MGCRTAATALRSATGQRRHASVLPRLHIGPRGRGLRPMIGQLLDRAGVHREARYPVEGRMVAAPTMLVARPVVDERLGGGIGRLQKILDEINGVIEKEVVGKT